MIFTPRKKQAEAITKIKPLLEREGFGALFMDMGTGKTFTALSLLGECKRVIIIAPEMALNDTWVKEVPNAIADPYTIIRWDCGKCKTKKWRAEFDSAIRKPHLVFYHINIDAFSGNNPVLKETLKLFNVAESFVIVDESSMIKSPDAKRSKAIVALGLVAKKRLILTGTEITNSPLDVYMQFGFLNYTFWHPLKSFYIFKCYYAVTEERYLSGGRTFKEVVGYRRMDELQAKIEPYCYRVKIEECEDMPEKVYAPIVVYLGNDERKAYDEMKRDLMHILESGEVLTVENKVSLFTKFRQIVGGQVLYEGETVLVDGTIRKDKSVIRITQRPAKLKALLDDLADTDAQAIIWASFRHEIALISDELKAAKLGIVATYYGDTSSEDRLEAIQGFQSGKIRFFVGNPHSAGYSLNLQNAHLMYFYSKDASYAVNEQAERRIYRINQRNNCIYKPLIARDTVDERIDAILSQKKELATAFASMSMSEFVKCV